MSETVAIDPRDGEPIVRIRASFPDSGTAVVYEYKNCWAFYRGDRLWIRSHDDHPSAPARISIVASYVKMVEHLGNHPVPPHPEPQKPRRAPVAPREQSGKRGTPEALRELGVGVAPETAGDPELLEEKMKRFENNVPSAMEQRGTKKYLESKAGDANPKDESSIGEASGSDLKIEATPSGRFLTSPLPDEEESPRPEQEMKSAKKKPQRATNIRRAHAKPRKTTGQALSALVVPLVGLWLAAFQHRIS